MTKLAAVAFIALATANSVTEILGYYPAATHAARAGK